MTSDFDTIRATLVRLGPIPDWSVNERAEEALAALDRVQAAAEQAEEALCEIVMAEPLEVDGRTMWPSFSGELQNKAAIALAVLRGKDTA